jgi:23S rRNA pseudouridine955/2504/2580 synthase
MAIGHPVAGDQKYGSHPANRDLKKVGLNRLFLHAAEVDFTHPESGRKLRVNAPIPDNLKTVIEKLQ